MSATDGPRRVSIRPGVSILSVLRHLNYKPWYALAEFVDNSLQSFLSCRDEIASIDGKTHLLVVISYEPTDGGRLIIRDNAGGIAAGDFPRAFRPAEIPPDRSGLSEFGMGMKSAACWFADRWHVRTSALGEPVERQVIFDISRIVKDNLEELSIAECSARPNNHFTEIVLDRLYKPLQSKTVAKIKEHLASIYRCFIRDRVLELRFNTDVLSYTGAAVLVAPPYQEPDAQPQRWYKDIDFDLGLGMQVRGFAALRQTGSVSEAGFALFRRGRLIQGSVDETYRPEHIFERANSFIYQRLFGELELDGFEVSHTKDGFRFEDEDTFLQLLKEHLNAEPLPLLSQATGHRARPTIAELKMGAEEATKHTADTIQRELPPVVEQMDDQPDTEAPPLQLPTATPASERVIEVDFGQYRWQITLQLTTDPAVGDWISYSDDGVETANGTEPARRNVGIRLALAHPFMDRFGGTSTAQIEPLLRVGVAVVLAELLARDSGVKLAGTFRRNINELLREALSKP